MTAILILIFTYPVTLYAGLLLLLTLGGIGLSIPDEAMLIFIGYLAYLGFIDLDIALGIAIAGVIAADIAGYLAGRFAGAFLMRVIAYSRHANAVYRKAESLFARHGDKIVVISRPLLSIRVAVPLFAGHTRMPFRKFLALDALAALPWAVLFVMVSYYLGSGVELITKIRAIKHYFFLSLGLAIVIYAGVRFIKSAVPPQS